MKQAVHVRARILIGCPSCSPTRPLRYSVQVNPSFCLFIHRFTEISTRRRFALIFGSLNNPLAEVPSIKTSDDDTKHLFKNLKSSITKRWLHQNGRVSQFHLCFCNRLAFTSPCQNGCRWKQEQWNEWKSRKGGESESCAAMESALVHLLLSDRCPNALLAVSTALPDRFRCCLRSDSVDLCRSASVPCQCYLYHGSTLQEGRMHFKSAAIVSGRNSQFHRNFSPLFHSLFVLIKAFF